MSEKGKMLVKALVIVAVTLVVGYIVLSFAVMVIAATEELSWPVKLLVCAAVFFGVPGIMILALHLLGRLLPDEKKRRKNTGNKTKKRRS